MAAWMTAARQVANLTRIQASRSSIASANGASLLQRRGLASAADHHGPAKVDCWKEPMNPGNWKEEQFVIVSLAGWGLVFYGAYKFFTKGKKEVVAEGAH